MHPPVVNAFKGAIVIAKFTAVNPASMIKTVLYIQSLLLELLNWLILGTAEW